MKVLVIQPAFIGDAIISIALAEALKKCDFSIEISYVVRPEAATLLTFAPSIDKVIIFDKYGEDSGLKGIARLERSLNSKNFDAVFCLHSSSRTINLLRKLKINRKITSFSDKCITDRILVEPTDDATQKAVRLASALYKDVAINTLPKLVFPESLIPKNVLELPRPIIGLAPGSVWKTKRWGAEKFIQLAESALNQGKSVVLLGLITDVDDAIGMFDNLLYANKLNLLSALTLEETGAVISYLDYLISNDSAPVHIATASNTPVIDILGPTVKEMGFVPKGVGSTVIEELALWCRPCSSHGSNECPIHTHECMSGISVESILEAVAK